MIKLFQEYIKRFLKSIYLLSCAASLTCLSACAQWIPGLSDAIDDYVNDEAICVKMNKEAVMQKKNVNIQLNVTNCPPLK